jgi:hypothetical protein
MWKQLFAANPLRSDLYDFGGSLSQTGAPALTTIDSVVDNGQSRF